VFNLIRARRTTTGVHAVDAFTNHGRRWNDRPGMFGFRITPVGGALPNQEARR
jgi:hypothetical protein